MRRDVAAGYSVAPAHSSKRVRAAGWCLWGASNQQEHEPRRTLIKTHAPSHTDSTAQGDPLLLGLPGAERETHLLIACVVVVVCCEDVGARERAASGGPRVRKAFHIFVFDPEIAPKSENPFGERHKRRGLRCSCGGPKKQNCGRPLNLSLHACFHPYPSPQSCRCSALPSRTARMVVAVPERDITGCAHVVFVCAYRSHRHHRHY